MLAEQVGNDVHFSWRLLCKTMLDGMSRDWRLSLCLF